MQEEQANTAQRAEMLIALTSTPAAEELDQLRKSAAALRESGIAIAIPVEKEETESHAIPSLLPYTLAGAAGFPGVARAEHAAASQEIATRLEAKAVVLASSGAANILAHAVELARPVLDGQCELAMPVYSISRYEALLNRAVLEPLSATLYGRHVRFPLPLSFAASPRLLQRIVNEAAMAGRGGELRLLWPSLAAIRADLSLHEVSVDVAYGAQNEGMELSGILNHVCGSLFEDMEQHASFWQRIRGVQPVAARGEALSRPTEERVDPAPLRDSFLLGQRNLEDIWSLVLTPVTLVELKRMAALPAEAFSMADSLWARIVYDFALAFRLRTLNRSHLFGAFVPLYLGWVASYAREAAQLEDPAVRRRHTELLRAFETNKPYLVSRWRWPDRFNP